MNVRFDNLAKQTMTFAKSGSLSAGQVCKMKSNDTVCACSDGDVFMGVVESVNGDVCGVTVHGMVCLSYSGSTEPSLGWTTLLADGSGGVKADDIGWSCLVVNVDSTNHMLTMLV